MQKFGLRRLGAALGSLFGSLAFVCVPYVMAGSAPSTPTIVFATVSEWSVQPNLLHVPANTPVTLVFEDQGRLTHELVVPDLRLDIVTHPGREASASFASAPVGVYRWMCVLPEHQSAGMQGWVVVGGTIEDHVQHSAAN